MFGKEVTILSSRVNDPFAIDRFLKQKREETSHEI